MIVGGSKCAMASKGGCQGRLERHHVFPQSRLKREFKYGALSDISRRDEAKWTPAPRTWADGVLSHRSLDSILADPRNLIWLCQAHHERVTNHREYTDIPDSVWEFCRDFNLTAQLENDLRRAA